MFTQDPFWLQLTDVNVQKKLKVLGVLVSHGAETDVTRFCLDEASRWGRGQEMTRNEITQQFFCQIQKNNCFLCYFLWRIHFRVK